MRHKNVLKNPITTSLALILSLFICGLPSLALAKTVFNPPAGRGLPGRREPAGTRSGKCLVYEPRAPKKVAALTPNPDNTIGQTVSEYPSFFWYLPAFKPGYDNALEFTLSDQNKKTLYKTTFRTNGKPGVMSLSLPANAGLPPLRVGGIYSWSISVICDYEDRSAEDSVHGSIQRVISTATLVNRLKKAAPQDVPRIYAAAGIWHEALATLAELRRLAPNDSQLAGAWADLLEAVELQKLAQEPLVECCQTEQGTSLR